jgi:hypothetical protein
MLIILILSDSVAQAISEFTGFMDYAIFRYQNVKIKLI